MTLVLIVLSVIGFLAVYVGPLSWIATLTFNEFTLEERQVVFHPSPGEYWRIITPIFLHFGWLHITFNCLWLWELGALIEQRLGGVLLLALVLLCGSGSNIAQAIYSGPSLFGGMSGVVYALLGFCWVYNALLPDGRLWVPRPIIIFMLVWLVFCMVAPTELLGIGSIANAAHFGGLVLGCLLAAPVALHRRGASPGGGIDKEED
ncbi:MAG: rhomboid family intramembrane serine protease [Halieaceae bacterium]|nr:rhomboid family intramembrane serine protease [Halieaceae bacterium]